MIYLDNAATSRRKSAKVITALAYNTLVNSVNAGRGTHFLSLKGANIIMDAQEQIASLFNIAYPERIAFMQNATLALNMAIHGVVKNGGHVIITSMEHNSVLRPVHMHKNYTVVWANEEGYVSPEDIQNAIGDDTKLIICTHASNVSGSIQPIEKIGAIAKKHGVLFLVDASQTAGVVKIDVEKMNIDLLAFSGHKGLMGPLGTGGLYVGKNVSLSPIITGGTGSSSESLIQPNDMPDMLHSGTLNTPAIAALSTAVKFIKRQGEDSILKHERFLLEEFINEIERLPSVRVLGGKDFSKRNGTVAFLIKGIESQKASYILADKFSVIMRGGWHCAYLAHKTLKSESDGAIRASFGYYNNINDVKKALMAIKYLQDNYI